MAEGRLSSRTRSIIGLAVAAVLIGLWAMYLLPRAVGGRATYLIVSGHSMDGTFSTGDVAIMRSRDTYETGDIIGYRVPSGALGAGQLVIHRIVGGDARRGFITKGDNNDEPDIWRPRRADVQGSLLVRIPGGGKTLVLLRTPAGLATISGLIAFWVLVGGDAPKPVRRRSTAGRRRGPAPVPEKGL